MVRYIRGIDFTAATERDGMGWERDMELRYVVQLGPARSEFSRVQCDIPQLGSRRRSQRNGDNY
ncbi:OprD family outer membrane porin [Pseudomonas sp. WHRI 8519]|uniref:OprD family outer membrane porin n=1 Tax=Pseudomonas sp. WHRI 8519 TaxID=3162567 RepID=UPI003558F8A0